MHHSWLSITRDSVRRPSVISLQTGLAKPSLRFQRLSELLQFEISVKLLHSSIQHNKDAVYQHFISLIQRLGDQAILEAYHEEAERALLRPHLERFAAGIEWSLPLQRVYEELTEQRQPTDKFRSDVVQTYLKSAFSNYTISFHDDSPSRELTPGATCFVLRPR